MEILEKYREHKLCLNRNKMPPVPSNVKYNSYLKEIANIAEIKRHLTTQITRSPLQLLSYLPME